LLIRTQRLIHDARPRSAAVLLCTQVLTLGDPAAGILARLSGSFPGPDQPCDAYGLELLRRVMTPGLVAISGAHFSAAEPAARRRAESLSTEHLFGVTVCVDSGACPKG
jgi:hypothetical protein